MAEPWCAMSRFEIAPYDIDRQTVDGRQIRRSVVERYSELYAEKVRDAQLSVAVVTFAQHPHDTADWSVRLEASKISANQKDATFTALGFAVRREEVPSGALPREFEDLLLSLERDKSVRFVIVQLPCDERFQTVIAQCLSPEKDIDGIVHSGPNKGMCATAEGVVRLAMPFTKDPDTRVAVVGSAGFVGSGVVNGLRNNGVSFHEIEQGDDIVTGLEKANVIVSAASARNVVPAAAMPPTARLVVDAGFIPTDDMPSGSIDELVKQQAAWHTPVPGGVGPVEMAVLAERAIQRTVDPSVPAWSVSQPLPQTVIASRLSDSRTQHISPDKKRSNSNTVPSTITMSPDFATQRPDLGR